MSNFHQFFFAEIGERENSQWSVENKNSDQNQQVFVSHPRRREIEKGKESEQKEVFQRGIIIKITFSVDHPSRIAGAGRVPP